MIISADATRYSPPEYNVLTGINSPIPLALVTRLENFVFNTELLSVKDYILCDFSEYGWDTDLRTTHVFGQNTNEFSGHFKGDEWRKFDEWVKENKPKVYFKRELLRKDSSEWLQPIEYPFYGVVPETQPKEVFDKRQVNLFHYWGRSSEERVKAHAKIWESGAAVCDNIFYFGEFLNQESHPDKWVSLHIPHYGRIDLSNLMAINAISKLSLSMPGCGKKCFRHAEVPTSSIMVMERDYMGYQFPWEDEINCFQYSKYSNPIADIKYLLEQPDDLYPVYAAGVENARNYQFDNYTRHLQNIINQYL